MPKLEKDYIATPYIKARCLVARQQRDLRLPLDSSKYSDKINTSLKEGQKVGVTGTPAFLLGYTQGDGAEVKAVKFLSGALPFTTFKDNIDKLLDAKK